MDVRGLWCPMELIELEMHDCVEILAAWRELVSRDRDGIASPGASNDFDWSQSLVAMGGQPGAVKVWVLEDQGNVLAIVPLETTRRSILGLPRTDGRLVQERYATRSAVLICQDSPDLMRFLLTKLINANRQCVTLSLLTVTASANDIAVKQALDDLGLNYRAEVMLESPYLRLPASIDELLKAREKKFRYTLRSAMKKLEQVGTCRFVVYEQDVAELLENVYDIERASWKEAAGTSITQNTYQQAFYEEYLPKAAAQGRLHCGVLSLDGEPICYNLGIVFNGVYECLKTTFKDEFRDYSLGHLTYLKTFECLIARGVQWFDFQGLSEPSKLKWTETSYTQTRYTIYGLGARAWLLHRAHAFRSHCQPNHR